MAGLEPATEESLQISGRTHKQMCHRRPLNTHGSEYSTSYMTCFPTLPQIFNFNQGLLKRQKIQGDREYPETSLASSSFDWIDKMLEVFPPLADDILWLV
ncbi:hypothetical protein PoB_000534400 [Plakobranchus ocellatus]|uniref:Uncharacterized protein n=1 Tax=Plakobranchus ocellatus TaxID=259542 RepID=A0AAV3Y7E1_9GAST|nr:hypothetical protein PoB_000534400 [Plakobranchus ocellatus]